MLTAIDIHTNLAATAPAVAVTSMGGFGSDRQAGNGPALARRYAR